MKITPMTFSKIAYICQHYFASQANLWYISRKLLNNIVRRHSRTPERNHSANELEAKTTCKGVADMRCVIPAGDAVRHLRLF